MRFPPIADDTAAECCGSEGNAKTAADDGSADDARVGGENEWGGRGQREADDAAAEGRGSEGNAKTAADDGSRNLHMSGARQRRRARATKKKRIKISFPFQNFQTHLAAARNKRKMTLMLTRVQGRYVQTQHMVKR